MNFSSSDKLFTKKNIISYLILAIMVVGIPFGVKLVQTQQQLKSQAAADPITFRGTGVSCPTVGGECSATEPQIEVVLESPFGAGAGGIVLPSPSSSPSPQVTRTIPVEGKVFFDTDGDTILDTGESTIAGAIVKALRPLAPEVPGGTITPAQAAASTVLAQTATATSGVYSMSITAPTATVNLVIWVDPSSTTGQGGQKAIAIGAISDPITTPLQADIAVKP